MIVVDLGIRDLERDVPIVPEIVSELDGCHAAFAEVALEPSAMAVERRELISAMRV